MGSDRTAGTADAVLIVDMQCQYARQGSVGARHGDLGELWLEREGGGKEPVN